MDNVSAAQIRSDQFEIWLQIESGNQENRNPRGLISVSNVGVTDRASTVCNAQSHIWIFPSVSWSAISGLLRSSFFSLLRRTRSCPPGDTMGDTNLRPREDKINVSEPADSLTWSVDDQPSAGCRSACHTGTDGNNTAFHPPGEMARYVSIDGGRVEFILFDSEKW